MEMENPFRIRRNNFVGV